MSKDQSIRTCLWFETGVEGRAFPVHWTMLGQKFSAMNGGPGFPHSAAAKG